MKSRSLLFVALLAVAGFAYFFFSQPRTTLSILSGSENESLEPILNDFARKKGIKIDMHYKGSVDIMLALQEGATFDAVWPANSLWISLGDEARKVKFAKSIMTSPVVFGVKKSLAEKLGFVGKTVHVKDLLAAIESKKLKFMMTSATQSNSGSSAYFGFLSAIVGKESALTSEDLKRPDLKKQIRAILSGVNRSSGSSGWLKDLFLKSPNYDAMVNYESVIIEANQELERQGREPLYVVYPVDGIVLADSPLGFISQGDKKKEEIFNDLQKYLLSNEVQNRLSHLGRRTGFGGVISDIDRNTFRKEWGLDPDKVLSPFQLPPVEVIREALNLYQTEFRKPSYTVFCLDFSGSMEGDGDRQLKDAMSLLLQQQSNRKYMLQPASEDVTVVIAFSDKVLATWKVEGNNPSELEKLNETIRAFRPSGGTDIYSPVMIGLDHLKKVPHLDKYIPAVILMTDGVSNQGATYQTLTNFWSQYHLDVPVFAIMFGKADPGQLNQIAELSRAKTFDGRANLISAFRSVKGYN